MTLRLASSSTRWYTFSDTKSKITAMPAAISPNPRATTTDTSNQYDRDVDDFLRDLPLDNTIDTDATAPVKNVDEEIKVRKKRAPAPKLDENLLLSETGIPRLRRISKTRLKLKGKGHEFSDMARMLSMCQLWLDDMYPKAKFRDALAMVEKVGHSKRMQVMRRGWMDAAKPSRRQEDLDRVGADADLLGGLGAEDGQDGGQARDDIDDLFGEVEDAPTAGGSGHQQMASGDMPDDDELDALMAENEQAHAAPQPPRERRGPFDLDDEDDGPDADGLDALLNEQSSAKAAFQQRPTPSAQRNGPFDDGGDATDEDELDALLAAEPSAEAAPAKTPSVVQHREDHNFDDDEEAMVSMGGGW